MKKIEAMSHEQEAKQAWEQVGRAGSFYANPWDNYNAGRLQFQSRLLEELTKEQDRYGLLSDDPQKYGKYNAFGRAIELVKTLKP